MVQAREDSLRKLILNPEAATIEATTPSATNGVVPVTHLPTSIFNTDSAAKPGEYILENDVIKLTFNSLGGKITKAELKKYFKMVEMKKGLISRPHFTCWTIQGMTGTFDLSSLEQLFKPRILYSKLKTQQLIP